MEFEFDLIVIGGGSGGLAAAKEAATLGKKVALCDYVVPTPWGTKWGLGGTCVNVGCIPKKLMHRAASIRQDLNDADDFGWQGKSSESVHAWETLVGRIQGHVKSLNFGYRISLSETGVRYFNSFATFVDKHTIKLVKGAEELQATARNFIVAVGCRPKYPSVEGARELCITSDDLFSMRTPPGRTLVIGGSYVALECAGFLVGLGFDVVVMVRSVLLRGFDRQMVDRIETHMTAYGVKFVKNCTISSIKKSEKLNGIMVEGENKGKKVFSQAFDTVLLAIGRVPITEKLNLEPIGVRLNDETKKITVSPDDRTSVGNIFAIGDVADGVPELTPVAIQAGKFLVRRLYNFKTELVNYNFIPTTVFTPSEYACVGYSEDDAIRELGEGNVEVYHQEFKCLESVLNSSSKFHPKNYAKYITRKFDGKEVVIGAHIIAPNAGEIIQGFALAIKLGATKSDFDSLIGIHPTVAEVFTTLEISKSSGKSAAAAGC
ncbi:unnamed protein product [Nesidiocoris tenuis]|uniref:thioredoxin-disulfide reductase (NADPH) n=1 Tax=Nesidiocoris tenuis TaxID=355587 RepID=A0A6H5GI47_9HEMI|nr:unnamed protein product [Nesidiocoris tenuis]